MPSPACVLDASALLAAMRDEPGAATVTSRLSNACISAVNLSEVIAKLAERGLPTEIIDESLADLELDVRAFDDEQARRAGLLKTLTRKLGLSLADRACLALAATLDRPAITTDKVWAKLDIGVPVELIR